METEGDKPQQPDSSSQDCETTVHDTATTKPELSHVEALEKVKELTAELLSDPFLQDLPPDISLDEVKSKLALEQGSAITLNLRRYDDEVIPVIVLQGATVLDLMRAVEKEISRRCFRVGRTSHLSWKYVWKSYWLAYGQQRLENKRAKLGSYGIGNHGEISFVKRLRRENKEKRSRKHVNSQPFPAIV